ncbi:MAG TPA: type VI secretion system baseplate subunit TssK [Planctomycetota bacterium]|nr:type VI secretion system baseplate subunit TssK [Planctomycetota bacterium]
MDLPLPIHWHEGLFLQPQHFQQESRYFERQLAHRVSLLSPFAWGVTHLLIDEEAVAAGRLVVEDLEVVFRDGLVVQTSHLSGPLERSLAPFENELRSKGERLRVAIGVPRPQARLIEPEQGDGANGALRFRSYSAPEVADETTGRNEIAVERLRVNARLFIERLSEAGDEILESEDTAGFETIAIAEVAARDDVLVVTDFIPPTTIVRRLERRRAGTERSEPTRLAVILRRITARLRDAATGIAGDLHPGASAEARMDARLTLSGIAPGLATLEPMIELDAFRPVDFYVALCRVVGELSPRVGTLPGALPRYRHDDLRATFAELAGRIDDLLSLLPQDYEEVRVYENDGKFDFTNMGNAPAGLRRDHLERRLYFAVKSASGDDEKLDRWVQTNCIIGRRDQLGAYRSGNIKGIDRELQSPPPAGLRLGKGYLVYRLVPSGEPFERLRESPDLCFIRHGKERTDVEAPKQFRFFVEKGRDR